MRQPSNWDAERVRSQLELLETIGDLAGAIRTATTDALWGLNNALRRSQEFFSVTEEYWKGSYAKQFSKLAPDFYDLPIGTTMSSARRQLPRGFIRRRFTVMKDRMSGIESEVAVRRGSFEALSKRLSDALVRLDSANRQAEFAMDHSERLAAAKLVEGAMESVSDIERQLDDELDALTTFAKKVDDGLIQFQDIQTECGYLRSSLVGAGKLMREMSLQNLEQEGVDFSHIGNAASLYFRNDYKKAENQQIDTTTWDYASYLLPAAGSTGVAIRQTGQASAALIDQKALITHLNGNTQWVDSTSKAFGNSMIGIAALTTLVDLAITNKQLDARAVFHHLVQLVLNLDQRVYDTFFRDRIENQYEQDKWLTAAVDVTQFAVTTVLTLYGGPAGTIADVAWELLEAHTFDKWIGGKLENDLKDAIGVSMKEWIRAEGNGTFNPLPNFDKS